MSFWKDIELMENTVGKAVLASGESKAISTYTGNFIGSVLSLLDDYSLEELKDANLGELITDIMREHGDILDKNLMEELIKNIQKAINASLKFYKKRNVDIDGVYDEVKQSEAAAKLTQTFSQSLRNSNSELRRATVEILQEAVLANEIVQSDIEASLLNIASVTAAQAQTESMAITSAYNQFSRNIIRDKAGLKHGLYYGHLQRNSRHFCRIHLMKTFTLEQYNAMDNGMLNPVRIHKGGYRCIHSIIWVDPEWDDELKPVSDGSITKIYSDKKKKSFIKVYANKNQAKRLNRQVELNRKGFTMFRDSQVNDAGFAAIHGSWNKAWITSRKPLKNEFITELSAGLNLSDLGYEGLFDRRQLNNIGGPVDIILNGEPMEIKTPNAYTGRSLFNRLAKSKNKEGLYQGDNYIINLLEPISEVDESDFLQMLTAWISRHQEMRIHVFKQFADPITFEEITR